MKTKPDVPLPFWNLEISAALNRLGAHAGGLSNREAAKRLRAYGPNTIKSNASRQLIFLFLAQFKSPVTILLIIAACWPPAWVISLMRSSF